MADSDKAKAEKLAAAKKRVEQLKKQKAKQGKEKKEKASAAVDEEDKKEVADKEVVDKEVVDKEMADKEVADKEVADKEVADKEEVAVEEAKARDSESDEEHAVLSPLAPATSKAEHSRIRSTSFRRGSSGALSPSLEGENTAVDIYRKQAARIEELERQTKRLGKDAADAEKRWKKAEEELADVRDGGSGDAEVARLKSELAALQRQNSQLQARSVPRHGASASISAGTPPAGELEAQLRSKTATIENMELEVSRLQAQIERMTVEGVGARAGTGVGPGEGTGAETESEGGEGDALHGQKSQVAALEERLARAEKAAGSAQRELAELKRNLERMAEKAVREGSARTSAETQVRTLEKELETQMAEREELGRKAAALEKKVAALTTLHKEHDARTQALRRDKERGDHELAEARARIERLEADNLRMRKREAQDAGGTDSEHLDELEDEERQRLERRVRALEAENADLRHGIWQDRRKELQVGPDEGRHPHRFSEIDLSPVGGHRAGPSVSGGGGGGGLGDFFTALTGAGAEQHAAAGHQRQASGYDNEEFLDDDDMDFDEEAFRRAQEEEARSRLERVRELKRALKNWEGWRLDLVESRQGGTEGIGPVFEI